VASAENTENVQHDSSWAVPKMQIWTVQLVFSTN